ncbi:MAG: TlpA family protein disulfide reductase [Candidatus Marinimicrobia bacterium]|nr:TlpA family protein disulfide reductase [Candidatus Neomarinimicrobiota bacterium]
MIYSRILIALLLLFTIPMHVDGQVDSTVQVETSTTIDSVIGTAAPTFFLKSLEGDPFFLSRYVGEDARERLQKPLVFSFFASWCIPCRAEIPKLHDIQGEFPQVGIMLVNVAEKPDTVSRFVTKMGFDLPVLLDPYSVVAKKYKVVNKQNMARLPATVIIDEAGLIRYFHQGYQKGDEEKVREVLGDITSGEE